jgi:hypothetical protein
MQKAAEGAGFFANPVLKIDLLKLNIHRVSQLLNSKRRTPMKSIQLCRGITIGAAFFVCLAGFSSAAFGAQDAPQKQAAAGKKIPLPAETPARGP